ncbi:iron ABC transporter substrate-binding protein [Ammoniphilus oxalaticus]|uniref:Iron ABC transporter substrate-binding protein n=1 Tax=Ammoniphilus oxalaticus TaxID=66863 RepID=A0A419SH69_9BACL|nr:extracellular solute-binding protein [Ammoniphilus oxalaticus]RKD23130.1 iron ABC transporter substrate-binding protein [Ammoniphilus oxalaticus]
MKAFKFTRSSIFASILAVLFVTSLTACGGGNADQQGNKDGNSDGATSEEQTTLTLYNGQHKDATIALIEAFEKETGIKVVSREGSSNELAHQIVEEGDKSPADLIYTEETTPLFMLAERDLLEKIDDPALEPIPAEYRDPNGNWTGLLARSRVVAYNPELIDEADLPKSALDFAKPEWKDKVAFVPSSGAFQMQLSALIKTEGKETAKAYLEGLKEHGKIYKKNKMALEAVERGEIAVALINNYYWDQEAREKGAENMNSKLYFFGTHDIGDMVSVSGVAILKSSKHKEAAQKFIEFATGEAGQQVLTDVSAQYPLNQKVDTHGLKPFSELTPPNGTLDLGEFSNGEATLDLLQEVGLL